MTRQLTFDLPRRKAARGREDFFVAPSNALAMAQIEGWRGWPAKKLLLTGPEGAGKSHLAEVWSELSGAEVVNATALPDPATLAGCHVAVEDADRIAGDREAEVALFHLHNLVLAEGGSLLITARDTPARWALTLPDLASRMQGTPAVPLDLPDDALLAAVLVKLFSDRQIAVRPELITYLVPRIDRSLAEAARLVDALDRLALAEGRPVTRALAARLLDKPDESADT